MSGDERADLEKMIHTGRDAAHRLLKARILLKADVSKQGDGWSDAQIAEALETSPSTVLRPRASLWKRVSKRPCRARRSPGPMRVFSTARRRRNGSRWSARSRPRAMPAGPCACWKNTWSSLVLSTLPATAPSGACSKKRAQSAPEPLLGDPAQGQCRLCRRNGGRVGGLHPPARSGPPTGLSGRDIQTVDPRDAHALARQAEPRDAFRLGSVDIYLEAMMTATRCQIFRFVFKFLFLLHRVSPSR